MKNKANDNSKFDEADVLLQALDPQAAEPDSRFRLQLKNEVLEALDKNPATFTHFIYQFMNIFNKRTAMAGGGLLALGAAATVFGVSMYSTLYLAPADRPADDIFAAMAEKNPNGTSANTLAAADRSSGDQKIATESLLIAQEENILRTNKSTVTAGPKANVCSSYLPYGLDYSETESYGFYDKEHGNYSKNVSRDRDGKIYNYSLGLGDTMYEYYGGSFAVKMPNRIYTLMESGAMLKSDDTVTSTDGAADTTITTPAPDQPQIEPAPMNPRDFFGPDAKILGQQEINGEKYYIASWSYDTYCNKDNENVKVVSKTWVNAEDYSYAKEEMYLGSEASGNLIVAMSNTNSTKKAQFEEVKSNFNFDLNVSVREVNPEANAQGTPSYIAAMKKVLADQKISVLKPQSSKFNADNIMASRLGLPDPNAFRLERSFYPAGALGDRMATEMQNLYKVDDSQNAYITTYYSMQSGDRYFNIGFEVFGSDMSAENLKNRINSTGSITPEKVELTIDGTKVTADLYDQALIERAKAEEQGSQPVDCKDCMKSYTLSFTLNGHQYIGSLNGFKNKTEALGIVLTSLDSANEAELNTVIEMAKKIQVNPLIAI